MGLLDRTFPNSVYSAPTVLLRESYREGAKVCKRTLANLSGLATPLIESIRAALRGDVLHLAGPIEVERAHSHRSRLLLSRRANSRIFFQTRMRSTPSSRCNSSTIEARSETGASSSKV